MIGINFALIWRKKKKVLRKSVRDVHTTPYHDWMLGCAFWYHFCESTNYQRCVNRNSELENEGVKNISTVDIISNLRKKVAFFTTDQRNTNVGKWVLIYHNLTNLPCRKNVKMVINSIRFVNISHKLSHVESRIVREILSSDDLDFFSEIEIDCFFKFPT